MPEFIQIFSHLQEYRNPLTVITSKDMCTAMGMAVTDICLLCYSIPLDTLLLAHVRTYTVFASPFLACTVRCFCWVQTPSLWKSWQHLV